VGVWIIASGIKDHGDGKKVPSELVVVHLISAWFVVFILFKLISFHFFGTNIYGEQILLQSSSEEEESEEEDGILLRI